MAQGHSDKSANATVMRTFNETLERLTAGRQKLASLPAGRDEDAVLKNWLTGATLEPAILTIELYK